MPSLRPLTDVARTDAKFFADSVVPALGAAGFAGSVALLVTDAPDACVGDVVAADVIIEGTQADIEALLAGKQKSELSALDKLKAAKHGAESAGVLVRGTLEALRGFVNAVAPREGKAGGGAKDVASEAGAVPRAPEPDTMRLPNGRIVKGRAGGRRAAAAPVPTSAPKTSVVGAQKGGATDRVAFAVQNLAGFVAAGLARVESEQASQADGATWILGVVEARRG
jgi:hypothetical protein